MKRAISFILLSLCLVFSLQAQVVTTVPYIPTESDSIILWFDASKGNQGLKDYTGDIYAHTGVITDKSTSGSDWKYVVSNWGVNIAKAKLTKDANDPNLYKLVIGKPRVYYNVPAADKILQLAFVFRSGVQVSGSWKEGKDEGSKDIYIQMSQGIKVLFTNPVTAGRPFIFGDPADDLGISITSAATDTVDFVEVFVNDGDIYYQAFSIKEFDLDIPASAFNLESGQYRVKARVTDKKGVKDSSSFWYILRTPTVTQSAPDGIIDGITINKSTGEVTFAIIAPKKKSIYVLGDHNDWLPGANFQMFKDSLSADSIRFWWQGNIISESHHNRVQYLVDEVLRVADPYSQLILDPFDDQHIPASVFPNLPPYPAGKTEFAVTWLDPFRQDYEWEITDFQKPEKSKLLIYEMLARDFLQTRSFTALIDTLDYIKRLGFNAIELMPVSEFEGNLSWGYNPSFHFALDKFYGTPNAFKKFVDECHKRGLAVIIDVVYNHAFGQSPLVRLWATGNYGPPSPDNIYANVAAKHAYNVGYDLNHESKYTRYWLDRVNKYWVDEYKIDGYRFDLSKGFTQKQTCDSFGNNCSEPNWSAFDQSRIDILLRMSNKLWENNPETYVIFEHLGVNSEEIIYANNGIMLWGNFHGQYKQAILGYAANSDFRNIFYKNKSWTQPNLIGYMESHDEERQMYEALNFGRVVTGYNVKNKEIALQRIKAANVFFFTIPGPKMIWQFGEFGYDVSINQNGRTGEKPLKWNYLAEGGRLKLWKMVQDLIQLRNSHDVFTSTETTINMVVQSDVKRMNLSHSDLNVTILGNFNITADWLSGNFQSTGWWYEYFTGDSLNVTTTSQRIDLNPGQFVLYTNKKIGTAPTGISVDVENDIEIPRALHLDQNYPNPFNPTTMIKFTVPVQQEVSLKVFDMLGREVRSLLNEVVPAGLNSIEWNGKNNEGQIVSSGIYFYQLTVGTQIMNKKMLLLK